MPRSKLYRDWTTESVRNFNDAEKFILSLNNITSGETNLLRNPLEENRVLETGELIELSKIVSHYRTACKTLSKNCNYVLSGIRINE